MRTQNNIKQLGLGSHNYSEDSFEFNLTSGDDGATQIGLLLPAVQQVREAPGAGSGGGNVLFGDGSVRFVRDSIDPADDDVIVDGRIITAEDWG